jgi:hypothetical protein
MRKTEELFEALKALGAGEFAHFNGSLAEHLIGTEARLRNWNCDEFICRAGLFHAAYGTDGFGQALVPHTLRDRVADLIGADAEALVYLYCACDRKAFYPRLGAENQFMLPNRFNGTEDRISETTLRAFCELTLANETDIAAGNKQFRMQYGAQLMKLFKKMSGIVREQLLAEAYQVLEAV